MNEKQIQPKLDKLQKAIKTLIECKKVDADIAKRAKKVKNSEDVRALYKEAETNWRKMDKAFNTAEKVQDDFGIFTETVREDVGDSLLNLEEWVVAKNREDKLTKTDTKKGKKK